MALVIVGLTSGNTRRQGQNRFGSIQRLDLALLIHAQYNGAVGRIQLQAHDISHLLHELGIFGEFEILHTMGLQPKRMPDPYDGVLRQAVSAAIGRVLQCVLFLGIDSSVSVTTSSIC